MKSLPALPRTIDSKFLAHLADPDEKEAMVIDVQSAPFGRGPLTVPGATCHAYLYRVSKTTGDHRLIVPMSVWKANNRKIPKDIFSAPDPNVILLPDVIPWPDAYTEATGQLYGKKSKDETPEEEKQEEEKATSLSDKALDAARGTEGTPEEPPDTFDSEETVEDKEPTVEEAREELYTKADELGVKIDKRWGLERLQEAIADFTKTPEE